MYFVYFLRSISKPDEVYTGMSNNPIKRRYEHNSHDNRNAHTFKFRPWKLESFIITDRKSTAEIVERYFKNTSGRDKLTQPPKVGPFIKLVFGLLSSLRKETNNEPRQTL